MKKFLFVLLLTFSLYSQAKVGHPSRIPGSYVHDYASVLSQQQVDNLNEKLFSLRDKYSIETAVVFIESLEGEGIEEYTLSLGRDWGVGGKSNNGLIILSSVKDRKWRVEVGYGLEGELPDIICSRYARDLLVPRYREGKYYEGVADLIGKFDEYMSPNAKAVRKQEEVKRKEFTEKLLNDIGQVLLYILFFALGVAIVYFIVRALVKRSRKRQLYLNIARGYVREIRNTLEDMVRCEGRIIYNLPASDKDTNDVFDIVHKWKVLYDSVSEEAINKEKSYKKLEALINRFKGLKEDLVTLYGIEQNLITYYKLLNANTNRDEDLRSYVNFLEEEFYKNELQEFYPGFEKEVEGVKGLLNGWVASLKGAECRFLAHLEDRNVTGASEEYKSYERRFNAAISIVDKDLKDRLYKAKEDKAFLKAFPDKVNARLQTITSTANLPYISPVTQKESLAKVQEISNECVKMPKGPKDVTVLREFLYGIDVHFAALYKEVEVHNRKVKEEEEREREEERRKEREKRAKEGEERRRKRSSSYISHNSYDSLSSSSSSSDSSYSGGSFGGGGASGDW